jgi:hypothetical protein
MVQTIIELERQLSTTQVKNITKILSKLLLIDENHIKIYNANDYATNSDFANEIAETLWKLKAEEYSYERN